METLHPDLDAADVIKARLLDGELIYIQRGNILGWCHNAIHKGAVTKPIMDKHDCIAKKCPFLQRNRYNPFWKNYDARQKEKEKLKKTIREKKRRKAIEAQELIALADKWRSHLSGTDCDMQIVRVARNSPNAYTIFYVSDNNFIDGNRYPDFLGTLKRQHPGCWFTLRHIRDIYGNYVTRKEYRERRKK